MLKYGAATPMLKFVREALQARQVQNTEPARLAMPGEATVGVLGGVELPSPQVSTTAQACKCCDGKGAPIGCRLCGELTEFAKLSTQDKSDGS
jgi:hypothetical protein